MTGVVAALEAHHHFGPLRQPVDDLPLAFVTPLGADDCDIGHSLKSPLTDLRSPALGVRRDRLPGFPGHGKRN